MKNKAVDQQIIRETNQYLMLELIQKNKSVTRAFLSSMLNLSPPSVSSNVDKLIQRGILIERGIDKSDKEKLGRKGILIEFDRNARYILCVDLSGETLKVAIGNIYEEIIGCEELEVIENNNAGTVYQKMITSIDKMLTKYEIPREKLGIIVVATPGVIDEKTGEMKYVPQFSGWEEINIKEKLEECYKAKTVVTNDINAVTIGIAKYGIAKEIKNFVHINIELGIGGGVILDGKLYSGSHFASGEVGYMIPSPQELGKAKDQGSLESLISIPQIKSNIAKALGTSKEEITIAKINELYKEENLAVLAEIERVAQILAVTVINITALLDVELIILGGSITKFKVELIERIQGYIRGMVPFAPEIKFSQLEDNDCVRGAFVIGAEQLIRDLVESE